MFSKLTSFISASLRSLVSSQREAVEGHVQAVRPTKRPHGARGDRPSTKKARRESQVSHSASKKTQVKHHSPSAVLTEIPVSPPMQHMSAAQRKAYRAGEVVVKEELEDDIKISSPKPRRRLSSSSRHRSSSHGSHVQALHRAQEGGFTRSGRRVNRPKFFSPGGEMVPSDTNKYVILLSDSESD